MGLGVINLVGFRGLFKNHFLKFQAYATYEILDSSKEIAYFRCLFKREAAIHSIPQQM